MNDKIILSPEILLHIAQSLNLPMRGLLVAVIELLDDGGTVPFVLPAIVKKYHGQSGRSSDP